MRIIPKSLASILLCGAMAGCAGDDGAASDATPPSPGQSPVKTVPTAKTASPGTPPAPQIEAAPAAGKKAETPPPLEAPGKADAPKTTGAAAKLSADDLKAIKELPAAEQDAAIAQAVCPVSNHNLGGMGMPLKVTAEGRTFYLCCDSCEEKVKTDPKAVIAKLDKLKAAK
jgi:YHS domain-containing protein